MFTHKHVCLRLRAEERAKHEPFKIAPQYELRPADERKGHLTHERRLHQIELGRQNDELQRAHEELELSQARYFELYDLAPVGYLTIGENGRILESNLTAAHWLGVDRSLLVGHPFNSYLAPQDQDPFYLACRRLWQSGEPQTIESRLVKADKGLLLGWVQMNATTDDEGRPVAHLVVSDITEAKRLLLMSTLPTIEALSAADCSSHLVAAGLTATREQGQEASRGVSTLREGQAEIPLELEAQAPPASLPLPGGCAVLSLKPGEILYREGDTPPKLYEVRSGWVKLSRASLHGRDVISALLYPGDYFDVPCLLDGGPSMFTAGAVSGNGAEVVGVDKSLFSEWPRLLKIVEQQFFLRLRQQQKMTAALATDRVEQRVLVALELMAARSGRRVGDELFIPMPLTRQEFGELIGTSTESAIRILSGLRRRGSLRWCGQALVCHPELFETTGLNELLSNASDWT